MRRPGRWSRCGCLSRRNGKCEKYGKMWTFGNTRLTPARQRSAAIDPAGQYLPGSHGLQPVAPVSFWYVPGSQ
eukprot:3867849-Prymnesium_polylepis.2